ETRVRPKWLKERVRPNPPCKTVALFHRPFQARNRFVVLAQGNMEKGQVKWRNVLVNRPFLQRAKQSERLIAMPRRRVRAAKEREIEGLAAARDLHRFFQTRDRILVPSHQLIGQSDRPERIRSVRIDVESAAQFSDRTLKLLLNEEVPGDIR